jgi:precorrin-3B synthase
MTALAPVQHRKRGACPGLSAPMPTGDGLLVRLRPTGTVSLAAFAALCAAARRHGNGVIEITSRGSIQIRGLSAASAPEFAADIAALDIAAEDGVAALSNPLAGLDAEEILDAGALAADLRRALMQRSMAEKLSAKVSVAVDGGGAINLANVSADIRLSAYSRDGETMLAVAVGGDDANSVLLGSVAAVDGVEAATRLLDVLARRGRDARARNVLASEGIAPFRDALSSCPALCRASTSYVRSETKDVDGRDIGERSDAVLRTAMPGHDGGVIGLHPLRDGSLGCGVGLAFGHADADPLERLIDAANATSAHGFRAAPGRALIAVALAPNTAAAFVAAAEKLGFIVRADDPRRSIIACAGAPICASAHIASRALAPRIAGLAKFPIHISGCAKGCAHAAPAALTVVGTPEGCALIANGSARDAPFAVVRSDELPAAIARFTHEAANV